MTQDKPCRFDRLKAAHPSVSEGCLRALLIVQYNNCVGMDFDEMDMRMRVYNTYLISLTTEELHQKIDEIRPMFKIRLEEIDALLAE